MYPVNLFSLSSIIVCDNDSESTIFFWNNLVLQDYFFREVILFSIYM